MYPLAVCSILAVAIILERAFNIRHSKIIKPEIIRVIENIKGPEDLGLAYSICEKNPGPFSQLVLTALEMKNATEWPPIFNDDLRPFVYKIKYSFLGERESIVVR